MESLEGALPGMYSVLLLLIQTMLKRQKQQKSAPFLLFQEVFKQITHWLYTVIENINLLRLPDFFSNNIYMLTIERNPSAPQNS